MWEEMNEEQKVEETKPEIKETTEIPKEKHKRQFKVKLGSNTKESLENLSYVLIVISAVLIVIGIGLGSFIQGTVYSAVFGSFLVIVGIIIYIISQFFEVK